mmetsp:Transcript_44383/g.99326  ORF Transcript_44383/g.99326 Transcript_44383/m.99326 type:complete len:251 (+) Transcript_44383:187-939(+)
MWQLPFRTSLRSFQTSTHNTTQSSRAKKADTPYGRRKQTAARGPTSASTKLAQARTSATRSSLSETIPLPRKPKVQSGSFSIWTAIISSPKMCCPRSWKTKPYRCLCSRQEMRPEAVPGGSQKLCTRALRFFRAWLLASGAWQGALPWEHWRRHTPSFPAPLPLMPSWSYTWRRRRRRRRKPAVPCQMERRPEFTALASGGKETGHEHVVQPFSHSMPPFPNEDGQLVKFIPRAVFCALLSVRARRKRAI